MSITSAGDNDALARLATTLGRPPASLSAFADLEPAQLQLLDAAIDATVDHHQREIDAELDRALARLPRAAVIRLLRR